MTLKLYNDRRIVKPINMARIVGANISILAGFLISKPNRSPPLLLSTRPNLPFLPSATKMGVEGNAKATPEIKEPSPKIQKLHQNGVSKDPVNPISLLRVKKLSENAVLPSRGSTLSAGYDLSR